MAELFTVAQLVRNELPAGFAVSDDYIAMNLKINQSLLATAANISDDDKYTEANWPDNWNILISYLIVYQIFQTALLGGVIQNSGTSNTGTVGKGQLKKITTGPTEVEWQDTAAAFSTLVKNLTLGTDSIFNAIIANACAMSRIVGIKIPFCKGVQLASMFVKAGCSYDYEHFITLITYEAARVKSSQILII